MTKRFTMVVLGLCLTTFSGGCDSSTYLMPTPNVYTNPAWNPFADVPPAFQNDTASVLYITDRVPEQAGPDNWAYGSDRSRSAAFGETVVRIGEGLSWEQLVAASRSSKRETKVPMTVTSTRELGRFGKTPPTIVISDAAMAARGAPPADPAHLEAERRFREELTARLAKTPRKEVFIYVHGFANTFDHAAMVTAELWHFLGREGVPVCYTWPAGVGGIRAYEYTVASTQFTVYHFKQALRLIASCPEVEKIHILGHSRGTAVTMDTIRELHLEIRGTADTQKTLKLGTVILAAADIDLDVVIARDATERVGRASEHNALYISEEDPALGFSNWLSSGVGRLGKVDVTMFNEAEIAALRGSTRLQLIDARVTDGGHSYYHNNPAVSSDVVLLLRYRLLPGAEHGRPLGVSEEGFWVIRDDYPGNNWSPPTAVSSH